MVYRKRQRRRQIRVKTGPCPFCKGKKEPDYKKPEELRQFISERGRVLARSRTGVCARHQRRLAQAVKRARHLALLPFV